MARDYTSLITSQHRDKSRFMATVALTAGHFGAMRDLYQQIGALFDLDTATGKHLDYIGQWVGISRSLKIPVASANYFAFDEVGKGWDEGFWKPGFASGTEIATLDDISYRAAIRLKIAANQWDGTLGAFIGRQMIWENASAPNVITYIDNQNMTFAVKVTGPMPSDFLKTVILQEGLFPRPMGTSISSITYA